MALKGRETGLSAELSSSRSMLSILGVGSLLVLYSIYRADSVIGLVDETDWLYPLPHFVTAVSFLFAFLFLRRGNVGRRIPWKPIDGVFAGLAVSCLFVLYCETAAVPAWLIQLFRALLRLSVCYFLISWGFVMYRSSVRSIGFVLCGAFIFRGAFFFLSGFAGPQVMASSLVFLPAVIAVSLSAMREILETSEIRISGDGGASFRGEGGTEVDVAPGRVSEESLGPSFACADKGTQQKALMALCLMVGCCGYLLVYSRTMWFEFQDVQGTIMLQFFQAFSNAAIGLALLWVVKRPWNPQSVSTSWAIPLVAAVCVLLYVLPNIDGRITLAGAFGVDFAGAILLAATILVPFFFPRERRLETYFALNVSKALFQTFSTIVFSLSLGSELQTGLSVFMLLLLMGSFALYTPVMQSTVSQRVRAWRNDAPDSSENEELLFLRSELDDLRGELRTIRSAEAIHSEEERYRNFSRQFKLTRREEEVFFLLAQGYTAKSIAEKLVISPSTAKTHVGNVYSKMGVKSQQELLGRLNKS